jgi:hypothetical protein
MVFVLSILLAFLSHYIADKNHINFDTIEKINKNKALIQDISKNILYIYKNPNQASLDLTIFNTDIKSKETIFMWIKFKRLVQKFKNQNRVKTAYSHILIEKTVNDIYSMNLKLMVKFDKLIKHQIYTSNKEIQFYKTIQYILFLIMLLILIYLFSEIKIIISFIQQFSKNSKIVIQNSTVLGVNPIDIKSNNLEIIKATDDFNFLLNKINQSIEYSTLSMDNSLNSLEKIEDNIEEFLELIILMSKEKDIDTQITKKEDIVIESLEELMHLKAKLKNLKNNLNNLIKNRGE